MGDVVLPVKAQLVADRFSDCLSVGCRSRATAEDAVMNRGELICYSVSNVSSGGNTTRNNIKYSAHYLISALNCSLRLIPCRRTRVCTDHHTFFKLHCHDGGLQTQFNSSEAFHVKEKQERLN